MKRIKPTTDEEIFNQVGEAILESLTKLDQKIDLIKKEMNNLNIKLNDIQTEITDIKKSTNSINFNVFKNGLNNYNILDASKKINCELEKLQIMLVNYNNSNEKLNGNQMDQLESMFSDLKIRLTEIEHLIQTTPQIRDETQEILIKIAELKISNSELLLQRIADILTIFSFVSQNAN